MILEELKKRIANWETISESDRKEAFDFAREQENEEAMIVMLRKEVEGGRKKSAYELFTSLTRNKTKSLMINALIALAKQEDVAMDVMRSFYDIIVDKNSKLLANALYNVITTDESAASRLEELADGSHGAVFFALRKAILANNFDAVKKLVGLKLFNNGREDTIDAALSWCLMESKIDPKELLAVMGLDDEKIRDKFENLLMSDIVDGNDEHARVLLARGVKFTSAQAMDKLQEKFNNGDYYLDLNEKAKLISLIDIGFEREFLISTSRTVDDKGDYQDLFKAVMSNNMIRVKFRCNPGYALENYARALECISEINYHNRAEIGAMDFVEAIARDGDVVGDGAKKKMKTESSEEEKDVAKLLTDRRIMLNQGPLVTSGIAGSISHFVGHGIATYLTKARYDMPEDLPQLTTLKIIAAANPDIKELIIEAENERDAPSKVVSVSGGASSVAASAARWRG